MDRKKFIYSTVLTASGLMLLPNLIFSKSILELPDDDYLPLEAYKQDYQKLFNDENLSPSQATNKFLNTKYNPTKVYQEDLLKAINDTLKNQNKIILTNAVVYKHKPYLNENHLNRGFIIAGENNRETGIFKGPKKIITDSKKNLSTEGETIYIIHPAFLKYTQLEDYFCYGKPSSYATTTKCKYCNEDWVYQRFYYPGDSLYDRIERPFYHNAFCTKNPSTNSGGQRLHDGMPQVKMEDILPCKLKIDSPCSKNFTIKR